MDKEASGIPPRRAYKIDFVESFSLMPLIRKKNAVKNRKRLKESWSNNAYADPWPELRWRGIRAMSNAARIPSFLPNSVFPIK